MVESKVYLSLDIQDFSTNHIVPLKRGETGKKVVISLSDGGFPYHIEEGCYAVLAGEKPDGNVLFNHCDIDGDTIFYDVSEQTTAAAGRILAAINLYGPDDMLIVSAKFRILVDGTVFHGGKVESEPEVTALTHLISDAKTTIVAGNEMIEEATFARDNANAAAEKANNSAKSADDATTAANTAAQTAIENASAAGSAAEKSDIAASGADNARDNANAAASDANQAASDATAAAGSAISSAKYADGAGSAADAAAASANAAAQEARTAADVANEAAGNANSAAENARSGADAANTAASRADTAAAGANTAKENAETAAGSANAAAAAAQAVVDGIVPEITQIKDDLSDNAQSDAETRRKLDYLWKLNQGISYQFETDVTEAYRKTVPSGAVLGAVETVGGETVAWNQLVTIDRTIPFTVNGIMITPNEDKSFVLNGTSTERVSFSTSDFSIIRSPVIYGHKYILFGCPSGGGRSAYHINGSIYVGTVYKDTLLYDTGDGTIWSNDIADATSVKVEIVVQSAGITVNDLVFRPAFVDLTQLFGSGNEPTDVSDPRIAWVKQYAESHPEYNAGELVSADVESVLYGGTIVGNIPDAVRSLPGYGWSAGDVYNSIERTDTGWQYVQRVGSREYQEGDTVTDGVTTYYALDPPVVTDITDLMVDFPANFEVEPGGTLTFENAAKLPVPSSVEYLISLAEVNG